MTNLYNRWISVAMTAMLLLAGCSTDALREDLAPGEDSAAPSVYIRLQMGLTGGGIPGGTRADAAGTGADAADGQNETLGTTNENAVNSVDLLVFDAASGELLEYLVLSDEQVRQITVPGASVDIPLFVPYGAVVHIHAAVNMTDRMRREFVLGRKIGDIALASAYADYWDVINDFVPGSDGKQETLEKRTGGCIPMTGQFMFTGADGEKKADIAITQLHASKETALDISADVARIVAKVHVLTQQPGEEQLTPAEKAAKEAGVTYARSMSAEANESIGWIRQSDVRYMVNGVNKSTYLFPRPNDKAGEYAWKDRNMDLERYLMGGIDLGLGFDAPAWGADYVFYNGMSLHKENIAVPNHLAQAEPYVDERYEHTGGKDDGPDRYVRGLYCPENYFDTPTSPSFAIYEDAIPMVTHVSIAAKLTPRWIVILKDYADKMDRFVEDYGDGKGEFLASCGLTTADFTEDDVKRWKNEVDGIKKIYKEYFTSDDYLYRNSFRIIRTENEQDAADILNWSLKINNLWSSDPNQFELDKYPDGTFYVYDMKYDSQSVVTNDFDWKQKHLYLSAGAFASATAENIDIKTYSVPHLGGWGYYYTYLDELGPATDGKTPFTSSQVTRNTYYLLTVRNFGVPGGSISRPEYIKVNTEPVGWDYDGRGDIGLH